MNGTESAIDLNSKNKSVERLGTESTSETNLSEFADEFADEFAADSSSNPVSVTGLQDTAFSPDILMQMSLEAEMHLGEEDDEDLQEINTLMDSLRSAGIENTEQMKYDDLVSMLQRADRLKDEDACIEDLLGHTRDMLDSVIDDVGIIEATLEGDRGNSDEYLGSLANISLNFDSSIDGALYSYIVQTIYAQYFVMMRNEKDPSSITVDDIFHVIKPSISENFPAITDKELVRYLSTVIPIIVAKISSDNQHEEMMKERRKHAAIMLLKQDLQETQAILSTDTSDFRIIRQMFKDAVGNYYYRCRQCGELVRINNAALSIIAFPTERGASKKFFPKMSTCKCGCKHVLCEEDYAEATSTYISVHNFLLNKSVQTVSNFCRGAAFVRVEPEIRLLEEAIPYLFTSIEGVRDSDMHTPESDDAMTPNGQCQKQNPVFSVQIDEQEFFEAVRQFYNKLSGLDIEDTVKTGGNRLGTGARVDSGIAEDRVVYGGVSASAGATPCTADTVLSWQSVARFVCQCSGVDYREAKNKAIFSILSRFQENPYFREVLDMRKIWDLQQLYNRIHTLHGDPKYFSRIEMCQLSSLAASLEKLSSGDIADTEYRQYLYSMVKSHEEQIASKIEEAVSKHRAAIQGVQWYEEEYGFSKILNVGNYNLSDFEGYLGDEQLAEVTDVISDRIIVTNYANDFYKYWVRLGLIRKSKLESCLNVRSDVSNASKILKKAVDDLMSKIGHSTWQDFTQCFSYDSRIYDTLYRLYVHYKNYAYYKFCSEFSTLDVSALGCLPDTVRASLSNMIMQLGDEAAAVAQCSEYEFYLKDFTLAELDDKKVLLDTLTIGRYVPKRLPEETIEKYVERVNTATEEWTPLNSYDIAEYFTHFNTYAPLIGCWSNRKEIEFESYAASMFMYLLICALRGYGPAGFKMIGGTDFALNKIKAKNTSALMSIVHLYEGTYKVLHDDYMTSVADKVKELAFRYDNTTLMAYDDIFDIDSKFSLRDALLDIYTAEYFATDDDGVPVEDKEDVIMEIENNLYSCPEMMQKEIMNSQC